MSASAWKKIILGSTFVILSTFYTFLVFVHGDVNWNLLFGIERIKSLENVLVSPINFNYWNHFGSQVNLFLPWLTLLPLWPIFQINNVMISYTLLIFIINILTFLSSYYFCQKLFSNTLQSFLFSVIYTLSLTRFNFIMDNNITNYLVLIFLPMAFYGLFQMIDGRFNQWPYFALGMSLIGLTTPWMVLSMGFISVIMIALAMILRDTLNLKYWGRMLLFCFESLIAVVISTLGYTLPMIEQGDFYQEKIKSSFIEISKFDFNNYYNSTQNKYLLMSAAFLVLAVITICFFNSKVSIKTSIFGIIVSGLLSTDLIPWGEIKIFDFTKITFYFWIVCISLICLFTSYLLAMIVRNKSSLLKLSILILTVSMSSISLYVSSNNLSSGNFPIQRVSFNRDLIVHSPSKLSNSDVFIVDGKKDKLPIKTDGNYFEFKYYDPKSITIDVPIIAYENRTVQINNETINSNVSKRGTVQIHTQPGANIVQIKYSYSRLAKISLILNFFGLLALCWLILNKGRWIIRKIV
ncbi:hypothetical protein [Companilactobacillus insicii]|uniref:hypothetical protein n=1 Tax=Companilactobacillus insicii TaxID=1732567 RepID=UPI000F79371C|nr:hypothetical protein [Companilactobacillus insicii]